MGLRLGRRRVGRLSHGLPLWKTRSKQIRRCVIGRRARRAGLLPEC